MKSFKKIFTDYAFRETSIHLQISLIAMSLIVIFYLFNKEFEVFHTTDPMPELFAITPKRQTGLGGATTIVKTGLFVRSFPKFSIVNNTFVAEIVLWFEFDPTSISLETIEKFSFEKGSILYKSPPSTKLIGNNILATYEVRVDFTSNIDYRFFPFSDHKIFLVLTNKFISPNEMIYEINHNGFTVSKDIYAGGWRYVGKEADYGYSESVLDTNDPSKNILYPRAICTLKFAKSGFRRIFLIIIPILLMYFMSLFSMSLSIVRHTRHIITLCVGSMTSLLGYRFVIEKMSPVVGYFTLADYLYTYILVVVFFVFLFGVYSVRKEKHKPIFYISRIIVIIGLHASIIIFMYYLFNFWQQR